jgi:hypothetical protein
LNGVTVLSQHRSQISETKVSLVLKTNEHDRARRIAPVSVISGALENA